MAERESRAEAVVVAFSVEALARACETDVPGRPDGRGPVRRAGALVVAFFRFVLEYLRQLDRVEQAGKDVVDPGQLAAVLLDQGRRQTGTCRQTRPKSWLRNTTVRRLNGKIRLNLF